MTASAPTPGTDVHEDGGDDFLQRLGDLDRFIGTGEVPITPPGPVTFGALGPTTPLPEVSHQRARRLFHRNDHVPVAEAELTTSELTTSEPVVDESSSGSEAEDFLERLGDLDRFIGGAPAPATPPASPTDAGDTGDTGDTTEADEFLQRLGDLDRFIGPAAD